ncbi:hypothetical protein DL96DRAFT_1714664 [Flagelloscypha sp. PMI_526]|nr:hypothetical protein DL96DRAFT_1714664 [Flagelloscypha sp. PMI_526]
MPLSFFDALRVMIHIAPILATSVTWDSPSSSDSFQPGDTIIAKWTSADDKEVVSPSFRICTTTTSANAERRSEGSSSCGATMWPTVQHAGDHSYLVSLTVPDSITSPGDDSSHTSFYLKMEDDFGEANSSPNFIVKSGPASNVSPDNAPASRTQADLASTNSANFPTATFHAPFSVPPPALQNPAVPPLPPPMPVGSFSEQSTRTGTPAAAIAIPLSIFGAILLAAFALALKQRRDMHRERLADSQRLNALEKLGHIEKGVLRNDTISSDRSTWSFAAPPPGPVPLFMPPQYSITPFGYTQQPTQGDPLTMMSMQHQVPVAPPAAAYGAVMPPQLDISIPSSRFVSPFSRASSQASRYSSIRSINRSHHNNLRRTGGLATRQSSMRTAVPSRYPSTLSAQGHLKNHWDGQLEEENEDDSATGAVIGEYFYENEEKEMIASRFDPPGLGTRNRAVSPGVLMNKEMLFTERLTPPPVPEKDDIPASLLPARQNKT